MIRSKTKRRPVLWTALGFGVGIALGRWTEAAPGLVAAMSGVALVGAVIAFYSRTRWAWWGRR